MAVPNPEPGLVISYAYLWHREYRSGRSEGRKVRPCVILFAGKHMPNGFPAVIVLPVTHTPPESPTVAVEVPATVKDHLGLGSERCWIVVTEGNEFLWPGYDLHKLPTSDRYEYGFLPPRLFTTVRDAFVACYRAGPRRITPRV
jgi:hypothetical protein